METRQHQKLSCLVKGAAVLLSQSDNHFTIPPSSKTVDIEIVWLIFIASSIAMEEKAPFRR
jgi:hypothetical protein